MPMSATEKMSNANGAERFKRRSGAPYRGSSVCVRRPRLKGLDQSQQLPMSMSCREQWNRSQARQRVNGNMRKK